MMVVVIYMVIMIMIIIIYYTEVSPLFSLFATALSFFIPGSLMVIDLSVIAD